MAVFHYFVRDAQGTLRDDYSIAASAVELDARLVKQGFTVVDLVEQDTEAKQANAFGFYLTIGTLFAVILIGALYWITWEPAKQPISPAPKPGVTTGKAP